MDQVILVNESCFLHLTSDRSCRFPFILHKLRQCIPLGRLQVHGESHLYIGSKFSVADNLESTVYCLETYLEPGMKNYLFLS